MTHDYKAAELELEAIVAHDAITHESAKAIRHALLVADKLMQEPSIPMTGAGLRMMFEEGLGHVNFTYKAMRDQLLKKIE